MLRIDTRNPGADGAPGPDRPDPLDGIETAIARAADGLAAAQRPDGHWVFELEADCTIPSEYILLRHYLGEPDDLELEAAIGRYLRRIQGDHGGWPLFHGGPLDISATVKAYFALKMIGDDPEAPHMARARAEILARGGSGATNVFTRIQLALYGAGPWSTVPDMPVELILLPRWFPIHLAKMSYWARTVIVPLLVLQVLKPLARNPRGVRIDELRSNRPVRPGRAGKGKWLWTVGFGALDRVLKAIAPLWPRRLRQRAIAACVDFVVERLNGEDGLGAIYPAMANSVMMFDALGYPPEHPHRQLARQSVEKLLVHRDDGEVYCQPCVSPVWDTALAAHAMLEVGGAAAEASAERALAWLKPRQVLDVAGDWAGERPDLRPGGWAFQYANPHYPDLDDTAVVVLALDRARNRRGPRPGDELAIDRGTEWTVGMQSANGGWGAFDADNVYHYLNDIPFADHGALLDPPTVDVTARCVSMLAQLGESKETPRMQAALAYLEREQEPDGSWFGRWGVNYIYGTWSTLCALNAAGIEPDAPMVRRAVEWLRAIQNPDGGWGEGCESYALERTGHVPAASRASQTAWAVIGLMAAGAVDDPAVERGIAWLQRTQGTDGLWPEEDYTGGGDYPHIAERARDQPRLAHQPTCDDQRHMPNAGRVELPALRLR